VANLEYGGLSEKGDDSAWCKSMACLLDWAPDVLLLQEMNGRAPHRLQAHLWRTANELGMTPVLGPASPDSVSGNHPAVLVGTAGGLRILDAGPPPFPAGGAAPAWCEAQVAVPGMPHPVWVISVHLPARSATSQHIQAERLANLVAQRGGLVIAGGDWNGYAPVLSAYLQCLFLLNWLVRSAFQSCFLSRGGGTVTGRGADLLLGRRLGVVGAVGAAGDLGGDAGAG
jgi:hypothetical protein